MHLVEKYHYSLAGLGAEVTALRPTVVCGEIPPARYRGPLEGAFPPEAVYLDNLATTLGAKFIAADWRGNYLASRDAERRVSKVAAESAAALEADLKARLDQYAGLSLFDFFTDPEIERVIRRVHQTWIDAGGEAADGFWSTRNREIVRLCGQHFAPGARIVLAFGVDHGFAIVDELRRQFQIDASAAPRMFEHKATAASVPVIERWKANLRSLQSVAADKSASDADKAMVQGLGRVKELTRFIETAGVPQ